MACKLQYLVGDRGLAGRGESTDYSPGKAGPRGCPAVPRRKTPGERELGAALRELREQRGLNQEQVSRASGVHPTYISDVERGGRNPSWAKVTQLVYGIGASMRELGEAYDRRR